MKTWMLTFSILISFDASANFQSDLLKGKRGKTKTSGEEHWTLSDWLAQKSRFSLMDQWLAAHSHQPWFSVDLSAKMVAFTSKLTDAAGAVTTSPQSAEAYQTDISLWLLSLSGEYQKTSDKHETIAASGGLRLLGSHAQTTSLVARYGWQRLSALSHVERWESRYAEGLLQLYILQEFGIDGSYRYYFPATSNLGAKMQGHKVTAGVFFEFAVIRVFAEYFQEPLRLDRGGTVTRESADGYDVGLRIFL